MVNVIHRTMQPNKRKSWNRKWYFECSWWWVCVSCFKVECVVWRFPFFRRSALPRNKWYTNILSFVCNFLVSCNLVFIHNYMYTLRCTQLLPHPIRSFPCRVRFSNHSCYLKGVAKRSVNLSEIFTREMKFYVMPLYLKT